ncbi:MAG: TPM domain-containing protein [Rhodospirillaceae bacterium]|nr:TPM domain-containing protein [Rhodospirillaceae bacterium]
MVGALDTTLAQAAVAAAEKETSAEIVIAVTDVSENYAVYPALWAAVTAVLAIGAEALLWPESHVRFAFAAGGCVGLAVWLILSLTPLGLAAVPAAAKNRAARGLAHLEFVERVAGRTAKANGILIFVALKERHVEVVPDAGFASKVGDGAWDTVVAAMVASLRKGEVTEAVVAGVGACARIAAPVFPYDAADRDEIADAVVTVNL